MENNLIASETLFVDDAPMNVNAAKRIGINTILAINDAAGTKDVLCWCAHTTI